MSSATKTTSRRAPGAPRRGEPPPFQAVQLAALVDTVPTGDRWLHEMKYGGYRTLLAVGGGVWSAVKPACRDLGESG